MNSVMKTIHIYISAGSSLCEAYGSHWSFSSWLYFPLAYRYTLHYFKPYALVHMVQYALTSNYLLNK